jgi:aspartate aminotransferase
VDHHQRVDQIEIDPELVLIGPGTKELLFLSQLCFEGDILVPTPCWVSYAPQAGIVGRRIALIPTGYDHGWKLRPDQIVDICRNDPGRPRMLILNYPGNPTGTSYDAHEIARLAEAARTYNLIVLSDEIYGQLTYDQHHISFAREYPEGTIVSSGLSKWCGAAGWRLGTFAFPPALSWLQQAMRKVASATYTCAAAPVQYAAIEAFAGGEEIDAYLKQARRILQALGRRCCGELRKAGCLLRDPRGGFYLFPDFTPLRDRLAKRGIRTDGELACAAIDELGVAFLPGAAFGMDPEQLTARIAYVDFDGGPALDEALGAPDKEIDDAFLRRHCGPVLEGLDLLCKWLAR